MKILYITTSTTIGGAERVLHSVVTGINRAKYNPCAVISLKPKGHFAGLIEQAGVEVKSLDMGYFPSVGDLARLKKEIAFYKPDIVHAFMFRAIQFTRLAKKDFSFKLISSPHCDYSAKNFLLRYADRLLENRDDMEAFESKHSAQYFISEQGYLPPKTAVVYGGVNRNQWFFSSTEREEIRMKLNISPGEILVCSVGRLDRLKGFQYLIKAAALVKNMGIKFAIVGHGSMEKKLRALAAKLKVSDSVIFAGYQENPRPWLCAADIFAFPTLWEGMGLAILEAMSVGLACAASSVGGVGEIIKNNETGMLVPPSNPQKLAEIIIELAQHRELREKLGGNAREFVRSQMSVEKMILGYEAVYEKLNN
ncbi:MAG: glycosyltransferase [Elusimicrobia bacterium]|nr:glycosyltransferase [Elusimicrobiota bacterium]